jgi:acylpyruvate hydrolase
MSATPYTRNTLLKTCRKLVCVGRNYAAHAKELGNAVPTTPVLFLKPSSALIDPTTSAILVPTEVTDLHHEVELGIVIGSRVQNIAAKDVENVVSGYVLGLDMTARNVQDEAKKKSLPWSVAKGYDTFAPIGEFIPKSKLPAGLLKEQSTDAIEIWCDIDGVIKQRGKTDQMIFSIPMLISYISRIFTLEAGDIILTGTPEGVGPVAIGQTLTCGITDIPDGNFSVKVERRNY